MRRRSPNSNSNQTLNVWPAFTDVMSNAFMILSLFLLLAIVKSVLLNATVGEKDLEVQRLKDEMEEVQSENKILKDELEEKEKELQQKLNELRQKENTIRRQNQEIADLKSQPPIEIKDAPDRKFESGSAVLSDGLGNYIRTTLVDQIEDYAQGKEGFIVQVIGHTDGQQYSSSFDNLSDLDNELEAVAQGRNNISTLTAGSNADLGLMRALAVVQVLQKNTRLQRLGLEFRAYSAAQLYLPSGEYAGINRNPDRSRRRIEIRFSPPAETQ